MMLRQAFFCPDRNVPINDYNSIVYNYSETIDASFVNIQNLSLREKSTKFHQNYFVDSVIEDSCTVTVPKAFSLK
jgi:NDP-sugar pyrophosphorylase family protein